MDISQEEVDGVWNSAESAKQIKKLCEVEQEIVRLMELASMSMSLLALPQTDSAEEAQALPRGPSRSDAFATNAEAYFETLNTIQLGIRTSIARVRAARIAPNSLKAPEGRISAPRALGTTMPAPTGSSRPDGGGGGSSLKGSGSGFVDGRNDGHFQPGFQERKMEAEAWNGVAEALKMVVSATSATAENPGPLAK
ncbi:hypothetical protein FRB91_006988 [Serendipita sp. 411]|nr:hypothetical protein FRC19_001592 [Serendipita sp. 401]KAG8852136.1 hypothetical protein FRB91_006988 [Serendipita sp. 411]